MKNNSSSSSAVLFFEVPSAEVRMYSLKDNRVETLLDRWKNKQGGVAIFHRHSSLISVPTVTSRIPRLNQWGEKADQLRGRGKQSNERLNQRRGTHFNKHVI